MTLINNTEPNNPYFGSDAFHSYLQSYEVDLAKYGQFRNGVIEILEPSPDGQINSDGTYNYLFGISNDVLVNSSSVEEVITAQLDSINFSSEFMDNALQQLSTYYFQEGDMKNETAENATKIKLQMDGFSQAKRNLVVYKEFFERMKSNTDFSLLGSPEKTKLIELINSFDNKVDTRNRAFISREIGTNDLLPKYGSSGYIKNLEFESLLDSMQLLSEGASAQTVNSLLSSSSKEAEFLTLANAASEAGDEDLASAYDLLSTSSKKLKEDFLKGMAIKEIGGDDVSESIEFFNNNYEVLTGRLKDEILAALESGFNFEDLDSVPSSNSAYVSIKEEFDTILSNLNEHALNNKSISQIMYENADRAININRDLKVDDSEVADALIQAGRVVLTGESNTRFDLNNDGHVDTTEYEYIKEKLQKENLRYGEVKAALDFVDVDGDKQISVSEINNSLEAFRASYSSRVKSVDFGGDSKTDYNDFERLWNIVGRDNGIDPNSFDRTTILGSLLASSSIISDRAADTLAARNSAQDEFDATAGQKWSSRKEAYQEYRYQNWALNYDNWFNNVDRNHAYFATVVPQWTTDEEATAFIGIKNELIDRQEAIVETIKNQGSYWDSIRPQHFLVSKDIHRSGIIVHGGSVEDSNQIGKIWDQHLINDSKLYANHYGISIDLTDDLDSGFIVNPEKLKDADLADFYAQMKNTTGRLINYKYAYRWKDDSKAELADHILDQLGTSTLEAEEALRAGGSQNDPAFRELLDKYYAQYDLLVGLFTDDASTKKAVNLVDSNGDNTISVDEMEAIINQFERFATGAEYNAAYDIDGDGAVTESDYDYIDNVIGYRNTNGVLGVLTQLDKVNDALDFYINQNQNYGTLSEADRAKNHSTIDFYKGEAMFDLSLKANLQARRSVLDRGGQKEADFAEALTRLDDIREIIENKIQSGVLVDQISEFSDLSSLKDEIGSKLEAFAISIDGDKSNTFSAILQDGSAEMVIDYYAKNYRSIDKEILNNAAGSSENTIRFLGLFNSYISDGFEAINSRTDIDENKKTELKRGLELISSRISNKVEGVAAVTADGSPAGGKVTVSSFQAITASLDVDKVLEAYKMNYRYLEKEALKEAQRESLMASLENMKSILASLESMQKSDTIDKKISNINIAIQRLSSRLGVS